MFWLVFKAKHINRLKTIVAGKYYANEIDSLKGEKLTAGLKAREDVEEICRECALEKLDVVQSVRFASVNPSLVNKIKRRARSGGDWAKAISKMDDGSSLLIQIPVRNHSKQASAAIAKASRDNHLKLVLLVHDLEMFRLAKNGATVDFKRRELLEEERILLSAADAIIVHNEIMTSELANILGTDAADKCISLGLFDYLCDANPISKQRVKDFGVAIAGNLRREKAGYAYSLPNDVKFHLYGVSYEANPASNVTYHGAIDPAKLPSKLEGSFGLVWDGDATDTCSGLYGEYLRVNNPHKTSLYLAAGMPVIIWKEAALSGFIVKAGIGFAVSSLDEISSKLATIDEDDYRKMLERVAEMSTMVRSGYFLKQALTTAGILSGN